MCFRAILTAFSTASAPVENSAVRLSQSPGTRALQPLGDADERLVFGHHEAGVGEACSLCRDALGDARVRGTDARDGDAAGEVDEAIPVDVDEHGSVGVVDEDREGDTEPVGDGAGAFGVKCGRTRAGDLGDDNGCVEVRGLSECGRHAVTLSMASPCHVWINRPLHGLLVDVLHIRQPE